MVFPTGKMEDIAAVSYLIVAVVSTINLTKIHIPAMLYDRNIFDIMEDMQSGVFTGRDIHQKMLERWKAMMARQMFCQM